MSSRKKNNSTRKITINNSECAGAKGITKIIYLLLRHLLYKLNKTLDGNPQVAANKVRYMVKHN